MEANFYLPLASQLERCRNVTKGFNATMIPSVDKFELLPGLVITYGHRFGSTELIKECIKKKRDFLDFDFSFFIQSRKKYWRLTKNGIFYHEPEEDRLSDRWEKLRIPLKPWKKTGNKIIVIPPSVTVAEVTQTNKEKWIEDTVKTLSQNTDREIVVKEKITWPNGKKRKVPLKGFLEDAYALVALHSNATTEAVIDGVPVFCGTENSMHTIAESDLSKIETPKYPDREQVLWNLAYQQFTLKEIASGYAKEILYGGV
jgi:hypothetical protein